LKLEKTEVGLWVICGAYCREHHKQARVAVQAAGTRQLPALIVLTFSGEGEEEGKEMGTQQHCSRGGLHGRHKKHSKGEVRSLSSRLSVSRRIPRETNKYP